MEALQALERTGLVVLHAGMSGAAGAAGAGAVGADGMVVLRTPEE